MLWAAVNTKLGEIRTPVPTTVSSLILEEIKDPIEQNGFLM
jgi:hypothetical protein